MARLAILLFLTFAFASALEDRQNEIHETEIGIDFPGKPVFDFQKFGWRFDVRIVPEVNSTENDRFPDFPFREIGNCVLDFSFVCVQKRLARYVEDINQLDDISLFGRTVEIVRAKAPATSESRAISEDISDRIDRSVDDFFDSHALRITLPRWNGKSSQVNVMYNDTSLVEGRGKKSKGGKCKKMMMAGISMLKMKFMGMMGMASFKGMMMAGLSLMMSKMMLLMKLMSLKKGGGGGGGGDGGSKEVIWVSKGGGGGGGCCGGGSSPPADSYGAPPPSNSYGPPSGGSDWSGGGGGGGGGWGRSFERRTITDYDYPETEDLTGPENADPNLTANNPESTWQVERNLTDTWNESAPLRTMTYPTPGEENKLTYKRLARKDDREKYNAYPQNYRKVEIKKYNLDHFARIRNLLLRNSTDNLHQ